MSFISFPAGENMALPPSTASGGRFADDVRSGLAATPKYLPCKYLYDGVGSRLFQEIMELEEYYPTRCELEIITRHQADIIRLMGRGAFNLVELGAGDGVKTKILLSACLAKGLKFQYVPIDISTTALEELTGAIQGSFCGLTVQGLATDYFAGLQWLARMNHGRNVVLFLGSNIGNFTPAETQAFLSSLRGALKDGDLALIGFDLKKDIETLRRAYNDSRGVTARFNRNILRRINDDLGGDFALEQFTYYSTYNPCSGAMESFLISRKKQTAYVEACGQRFFFGQWEAIHTESSYKFQERDLARLAQASGFEIVANFYDSRRFFTDSLWQAAGR